MHEITPVARQQLLEIARRAITAGLDGQHWQPKAEDTDPNLREPGCSFVTLHKQGFLRGCIGALSAYQPLYEDVAEHAFAAAFSDPRFPPLDASEIDQLHIEISLLSPEQPIAFRNKAHLLNQLRPGIDGLTIRSGGHQATFLPAVWQQLPQAEDFLQHLLKKAGLPQDSWPDNLQAWRYTTEQFGE
jgi:AmmeMemoRadiSam system protein A